MTNSKNETTAISHEESPSGMVEMAGLLEPTVANSSIVDSIWNIINNEEFLEVVTDSSGVFLRGIKREIGRAHV